MRTIKFTGQYKKDLKIARKRHLPEDKLNEVIFKLANDVELPESNRDHALSGDYIGTRECHIQPDWFSTLIRHSRNSFRKNPHNLRHLRAKRSSEQFFLSHI